MNVKKQHQPHLGVITIYNKCTALFYPKPEPVHLLNITAQNSIIIAPIKYMMPLDKQNKTSPTRDIFP